MNNKAKAKEMGIVGGLLTIVVLIIVGVLLVSNNTATDDLGKQSIDFIGYAFIFIGVLILLILVLIGLLWLAKELGILQ